MPPLIISFYTNDWEYPQHAVRLRAECEALGITNFIAERASTADYIKNTAIKPFFILEMLNKFKRPLFWVDVDAMLLQPLTTPTEECDIAACRYANENINRQWAVATLWFNYTPAALEFLAEWCAQAQNGTDEAAFDAAWRAKQSSVVVSALPNTYHFVKWSHRLEIPADTVVCHQLSKFEDKMRRKEQSSNG